jgi:hypothetical protein
VGAQAYNVSIRKLRQEDRESEASLGYRARPYLTKARKNSKLVLKKTSKKPGMVAHVCNPI